MLVAMFVTPAGVAGVAAIGGGPVAAMAATVYAIGAVCFIAMITFRLTVVPWAAERDGDRRLAAGRLRARGRLGGHALRRPHGVGLRRLRGPRRGRPGVRPAAAWIGWLGVGLGLACLAGFVATRFAGPFNPPILAHTYTAVVGVALLVA